MLIKNTTIKSFFKAVRRFFAAGLAALMLSILPAGCALTYGTKVPTSNPTGEPKASFEIPTDAPTDAPPATAAPGELARRAFSGVVLPRETKLDYFKIPNKIIELLTEDELTLYPKIVAAYLEGKSEVELPSDNADIPNLFSVIELYFPVFYYDVDEQSIGVDGNMLVWKYKTAPAEHEAAIDRFESKVLEIIAPARSGSLIMRQLCVYREFTAMITYDDSTESDDEESYIYPHSVDAIMQGRGLCWCFARAYSFLICQLGVESATVHGTNNEGGQHEWTVFSHNGEWYYADPTWDRGGDSLLYFGFTTVSRNGDGYPDERVFVLSGNALRASSVFDVSDRFFEPLYTGQIYGDAYALDPELGMIAFEELVESETGEQQKHYTCFLIETGGVIEKFEKIEASPIPTADGSRADGSRR